MSETRLVGMMIDFVIVCNPCGHTIGGYYDGDPPPPHPIMNIMCECPKCDNLTPGLQIDLNQYAAIQEVLLTGFVNFLQGEVYRE